MSASTSPNASDASNALDSRLRADAEATAGRLADLEAEHDAAIHDPDVLLEDRDTLRAMVESARHRANAASDALARYEQGTYGNCQVCGDPIGAERLEALPEATTCVGCH